MALSRRAKFRRLGLAAILLVLAIIAGMEAVLIANGFHLTDGVYYYTRFEQDFQQLQGKYGISLVTEVQERNYPKGWTSEIVFMPEVVPLENRLGLSQVVHALTLAIEKYPASLIRREIKGIVLLETLTVNSFPYGGTYDAPTKRLFIARKGNKGAAPGVNFLQETFHHEFSSLLKRSHPFSEQDWKNASGQNFTYRIEKDPGLFINMAHGLTEKPDDATLYQRGLLNFYSETGLENDFNAYAETVFTHPLKVRALIRQYPVIRDKYAVFKTFYLGIDKGFAPVFAAID
ncbi:MAG: hypothetical protein HY308_04945 [Gammaproteobacteria bacterium]|nr:hypothetical protein [Gammaproteobacteria bacterium]